MRYVEARERSLATTLALGPALLAAARSEGTPWLAASVVAGPAVVLGAAQRAGRVVDLAACRRAGATVVRRATTGTAAWVGATAVVWSLALPRVDALMPGASVRTVLNRNVRGFLQGLSRAGALASYFGREWIAVKHGPAALLGYDLAPDGATLVEVIAAWDAPIALPHGVAADDERRRDRWRERAPVALAALLGATRDARGVAHVVAEAVAARGGTTLDDAPEPADLVPVGEVVSPDDPLPAAGMSLATAEVPIGCVEAAAGDGVLWVGGDVLTGRWVLDAAARAAPGGGEEPEDAPLDGARWADLVGVARAALAGRT